MSERLRITGGERRGRRLQSPPRNSIRPASDMVRQAVFNMLGDAVVDSVFFDVFAGTGIVGIEALSRGAQRAIFIEFERRRIGLIRQNLRTCDLSDQASVRHADAFSWGRHFYPDPDPTIVFLGPPYPMFDSDRESMWRLVEAVQEKLRPMDRLVLQYPSHVSLDDVPKSETWFRNRKYGKTHVGIWFPAEEVVDDERVTELSPETVD